MSNKSTETPNDTKPVLGTVFSPWDYAEEAFSETLNYMSDDELSEIDNYNNEDEELSELIVRIQHKVPKNGSVIIKHKDKYYRIRELG